jgi:pantetheine-phosphate adenylyltransferase
MNRTLDTNIETVFLTCLPQYTSVASTLVRDVLKNGGDVTQFLPGVVHRSITGLDLAGKPLTPHRRTY